MAVLAALLVRPGGGTSGPAAPHSTPAVSADPTPAPSAPGAPASPVPSPSTVVPTMGGEGTLVELLELLTVAPEVRTGYERSLFTIWIDADGDGCDTRREVLIAESLTPVRVAAGCWLSGGTWTSLYDGVTTTDPTTFDIDHVVPLAEAWDSGAAGWSTDRRTRFANDLTVDWALIAVTARSNRAKSDRDPTEWLPPLDAVRCEYVSMWLAVKVRWQLAVDASERSTLSSLIDGCEQVMVVPIAG